jgi:hypothetical protein
MQGGGKGVTVLDFIMAIKYKQMQLELKEEPGLDKARSQASQCLCVGSVTTLLLAETKESERMDTSSKQQRTYGESKRESGKRNGKSKEVGTETGNWKSLNWESLKLETGK